MHNEQERLSGWIFGRCLICVVALIIIIGVLLSWWMTVRTDSAMRRAQLLQARMVAEAVNIKRVKALSGTLKDLDNADYVRLKEQFSAVCSSNPQCRFIYLMGRKTDASIFFFLDSERPDSKDYSPPGQVYAEAPESYMRVFDSAAETVAGPVADRWGVWISSLVPLIDPETGALLAVLGMDINASAWKWELLKHILPFWLLLALLLAIVFIYLLLRRTNAGLQDRQAEILAKEKRFREVLENSLVASYKRNLESGDFDYLSPVFTKISGYTQEEMNSLSRSAALELIHPHDRSGVERVIARATAVSSADEYKTEYRFKHKNGDYRWLHDQFTVLRDGAGHPMSLIGSISDITGMKQLSEAVRRERQRLSGIIRGTGVGTWEWNVQTGETLFNDRWAQIIGYTLEEIWPVSIKTWEKYTHPEDLTASRELLEKHFRGELEYYQCELRMKHKNGNWVWILDTGSVNSWTDDGKPLMMMGTHQDITRQKLAEAVLRASEEKHRNLIEHSHDIIYTLTADGVFTFVSPAWKVLLGHAPAAVVGRHFSEFLHPDDVAGCVSWLQKAVTTGQPQEGCVYRVRHADGSWRWHTSSGVPLLDGAGHVSGLEGIARDITEHKQAEEVLVQNQERLRQLSVTDDLTGLYSRRGFFDMAAHHFNAAKRYKKQLALLYCNLDGLKRINAVQGHDSGDESVKDVARALKLVLRSSDIAARVGGDEFAVLLPEANEQTARATAGRIQEALKDVCSCRPNFLCLSIGVREIDAVSMQTIDDFLSQAEADMRRSKEGGIPSCIIETYSVA